MHVILKSHQINTLNIEKKDENLFPSKQAIAETYVTDVSAIEILKLVQDE